MKHYNSVITGSGCYIPTVKVPNQHFIKHSFYEKDGSAITSDGQEIIDKFKDITGIRERRWVTDDLNASDIAAIAAERAITDAGIDRETIDQIIVAENFGNVSKGTIQTDQLPNLASRVKNKLGIKNPSCIPYDIIFGCPGWVQGMIQADSFIKSGLAKRCLVIGAETLSRVVDPHDRDIMIFSDGAGATILEGIESDEKQGIISVAMASHTQEEVSYLTLSKSNAPGSDPNVRFISMLGRKIYEYSLMQVPSAMKAALDKSGIPIEGLSKILIHQANEKMDEAIIQRFFKLYKIREVPKNVMPMNIHELGNSSVATIPTLYNMILTGQIPDQTINKGDILIFASVGAGMNINAFVYKA